MFKSTKIGYLVLFGLFVSILLVSGLAKEIITNDPTDKRGENTARKIPRAFQKAFNTFKTSALFYDKKKPLNIHDAPTLNAYLKRMDPTSEYLEPAEYTVFETSHMDNYVGIGMEIEKHESGAIVCYPYPGSPAHASGVEIGDILKAVDGEKVSGLSIYVAASKMMGEKGTNVNISVIKKDGNRQQLKVTRKYIKKSSVTAATYSNFYFIKLHSFTNGTRRDLRSALGEVNGAMPIILDLRDNPGGDLYKAIDSAMLFLEKDIRIATIKSRNGKKEYSSTTPAFNSTSPIFIWQNQHTASAAEVFIAALTINSRAESIGTKSHGKGITQDVVELDGGSAIVFASGYLMTPDDRIYHQQGLDPTHALASNRLGINEYLVKTNDLIKNGRIR